MDSRPYRYPADPPAGACRLAGMYHDHQAALLAAVGSRLLLVASYRREHEGRRSKGFDGKQQGISERAVFLIDQIDTVSEKVQRLSAVTNELLILAIVAKMTTIASSMAARPENIGDLAYEAFSVVRAWRIEQLDGVDVELAMGADTAVMSFENPVGVFSRAFRAWAVGCCPGQPVQDVFSSVLCEWMASKPHLLPRTIAKRFGVSFNAPTTEYDFSQDVEQLDAGMLFG